MILQRVEITVEATEYDDTDSFEDVFDSVAEAFYGLDAVFDQDLSGNAEDWTLTFRMGVPEEDQPQALMAALAAIRAALHIAGNGTPGWEKHFEVIQSIIENAQRAQAQVA